MGLRARTVGQAVPLLVVLTLLHPPTARGQSTICNRVWVEVRRNDLMGNSDLTAPPDSRFAGRFCFVVYDRNTARFSLEPDDPAQKSLASLMLRKRARENQAGSSSYARSSPDYNEERIRGRNDFLFLRTHPGGERHYGATVTDLSAGVTLSCTAIFAPTGPRLDDVPPLRATGSAQVAAKRSSTSR
jgi:hypothetical protein